MLTGYALYHTATVVVAGFVGWYLAHQSQINALAKAAAELGADAAATFADIRKQVSAK